MVLGSSSGSASGSRRDILEVPSARALSATRGSFCTTCNGQLGTGGGPGLLLHLLQKQPTTIDIILGHILFTIQPTTIGLILFYVPVFKVA